MSEVKESKIEQSIKAQKEQLVQLEKTVEQIKGAIAALEYVKGLGLVEPEPVPETSEPKPAKKGKNVVDFPGK